MITNPTRIVVDKRAAKGKELDENLAQATPSVNKQKVLAAAIASSAGTPWNSMSARGTLGRP